MGWEASITGMYYAQMTQIGKNAGFVSGRLDNSKEKPFLQKSGGVGSLYGA